MPSARVFQALLLAVGPLGLLSACGEGSSTTPTPTPTPVPTLSITCPAAQTGVSVLSQPVTISWTAPTTSGGTSPVQTSCVPASGSSFSAGTAAVTCTATDAASQSATCAFNVVITRPPQIAVTRFLAYGDSITWGQSRDAIGVFACWDNAPTTSYPSQLTAMLTARYLDQSVTMVNQGCGGEAISDGLTRLPAALSAASPQALLLLDGANDLRGSPSNATADYIAAELRLMVRAAKVQVPAITVLMANYPPQFHPTAEELARYCTDGTNYDRGSGAEYVPYLNQKIAAVAASEGATLVDVYTPMSAAVKTYIGCDGLHPTVAGYTVMAETFQSVLQQKFETLR
jgi:lysophospholipase L1-like esterase